MTYNTRQEVLRAAADWIDVCEEAGIEANCKWGGTIGYISNRGLHGEPKDYEFPLALLEGKEVWIGSELYDKEDGIKVVAHIGISMNGTINRYSWNPPKPKTVMVEMLVEDAEQLKTWFFQSPFQFRIQEACKKALEKL